MSEQDPSEKLNSDHTNKNVPKTVAIEGDLPLTAINIESQKDMESGRYHPLRSLDKWFAARPTPAARLSVLGSVLPDDTTEDELLRLMEIGSKERTEHIGDFVIEKFEQKSSKKGSNETLDEYYGFSNPNTRSPTRSEVNELHKIIKDEWGSLPTVLDPTAGRGIIPYEALRYDLPVVANELNPIPTIISKVALEYASEVGSVTPEVYDFTEEIIKKTKENISNLYPTKESSRQSMNSVMTYQIICDSCGGEVPLTTKWWLNKSGNNGDAIEPHYNNGEVEYKYINITDQSEFDPSNGPVSRGGNVECPHCTVTMSTDTVRKKFREDEFEYCVYAVNYEKSSGEWGWRGGDTIDQVAIEKATNRVDSDFEMLDFFSESYDGGHTDRVKNYGVDQWRDLFTPRQLIAHYELFKIFKKFKQRIYEEYAENKAELIITLLAIGIERTVQHNNRLAQWKHDRGVGSYIFSNNNFSFKRIFVGNNICAPRRGLERRFERAIESYESIASYVNHIDSNGEILQNDAVNLTNEIDGDSVEVAIVDPPYFDSIMYGELSDFMYVTKKRLLDDVFPEIFDSLLVEKKDQAVANPDRQDDPEEFYENKMKDIFVELSDILVDDGILTLMFTDREVQAWNTISKAIIESGFTITASHPIKTEMSDRIGAQDTASVNSSILLIARNQSDGQDSNLLWEEIENDIEKTARKEAQRLLSIEDIDKVDASIAAFGPALQQYSEAYPIEDKQGKQVEPKKVLEKARQEVTNVIANDELNTETDPIDGLTRWYILSYTIYGEADIPFDEANQLGIGTDVEITELKRPTKIWSKSSGDVSLNHHTDRVQDIVKLRDDRANNPSSRKYPVNPTKTTFTYAIDAVHATLHVYEREGTQFTRDWLAERGFKNDTAFITTVKALLEAVPSDIKMHDTLTDLIAGETGDYLDVSISGLNIMDSNETQTGFEQFK